MASPVSAKHSTTPQIRNDVMNKTNILALAAHLEALDPLGPVGFDMRHYWRFMEEASKDTFIDYYEQVLAKYPNATECGCIAGHAKLVSGGLRPVFGVDWRKMGEWLELPESYADRLFNTDWEITAAEAAAKLRAIVVANPEDFVEGYEDRAVEGSE
jgi:hypothetical protein